MARQSMSCHLISCKCNVMIVLVLMLMTLVMCCDVFVMCCDVLISSMFCQRGANALSNANSRTSAFGCICVSNAQPYIKNCVPSTLELQHTAATVDKINSSFNVHTSSCLCNSPHSSNGSSLSSSGVLGGRGAEFDCSWSCWSQRRASSIIAFCMIRLVGRRPRMLKCMGEASSERRAWPHSHGMLWSSSVCTAVGGIFISFTCTAVETEDCRPPQPKANLEPLGGVHVACAQA